MLNKDQLALGIRVEMEHKNTIARLRKHPRMTTRKVAELIARDHLAEDPEYYTKLQAVESNPAKWTPLRGNLTTVGVRQMIRYLDKLEVAYKWEKQGKDLWRILVHPEDLEHVKTFVYGESNPGPMNIFELQRRIGRGQRALQERVLDTLIPEERGKQGLVEDMLPFGRALKRNPASDAPTRLAALWLEAYKMNLIGDHARREAILAQAQNLSATMRELELDRALEIFRELFVKVEGS